MVGSDWGRRAQRAWRALAAVAVLGLMALPAQAQETNKKGRCCGLCVVRLAAPMTDV